MLKIKSYRDNSIAYKIMTSYPVMLVQVLVAALCFNLKETNIALLFFISYIVIAALACRDLSPIFLPLMLVALVLFANYGATPETFKKIIPLAIVAIVALLLHFVIFPVKWRLGKMLFPMLLVSLSLTLGGLGHLSAEQYFKVVPLYYVFGLGFGLTLVYLVIINYTLIGGDYNPMRTLVRVMICIGLMGCFMIFPVFFKAAISGEIWSVQWSNNLSTMLIFSMPFSFYLAAKIKKWGVIFFIFGLVQYMATTLTLSRGGMVFGAFTMVISVTASFIFTCRFNRWAFLAVVLPIVVGGAIVLFIDKELLKTLEELLHVSGDEARVTLFRTAVKNFLTFPIFGTGLAFRGPGYNPQKWAIYWYHSTPFQVIGSLGIVGIIAYGIQTVARLRVAFKRPSKFNLFAALSLIGFEAMALVNPGDFTPIPSMLCFTVILAIVELSNKYRVSSADMLSNRYPGGNWHDVGVLMNRAKGKEPPMYQE